MSDSFGKEARAFLAAFDRLNLFGRDSYKSFPDEQDRSAVRVVLPMAEFMSLQRSNPLRDFTVSDLLAMDLSDSFLRWASDLSMPSWMRLFDSREELRDD
jgi:hypothetical protein